jgi:hypothetical protein
MARKLDYRWNLRQVMAACGMFAAIWLRVNDGLPARSVDSGLRLAGR